MPVLTAAAVKRYAAANARREIADSRAPGLYLVVQPKPSGAKSWALRFRRPDGRPAKMTLGRVDLSDREVKDDPVIGGALTLRQARQLANQIDRERARGIDVVEEHKVRQARQHAVAADRSANTFGACAREFFTAYKTRRWQTRPRRWREDASLLGLQYPLGSDPTTTEPEVVAGGLADVWASKAVADIDGHDVHGAIEQARKLGSDGRARKLHVCLSAMFRWLLERRRIATNAAHGVWRPGPPPDRERLLSDAEVGSFWHASDTLAPPYNALLKVLLLTGARLREVAGMRRDELVGGTWTIPSTRTKNHRQLALPLPTLTLDLIDSVPVIDGSAYVFTSDGKRPVNSFAAAKRALDAAMVQHAGHAVPAWRLHDLRRTAASGMAALGVQLPVIEKVLNHISGSFGGIVSVYQKHEYAAEKADALARWAKHVEGLVAGRSGKVVALKKR